ncbi:hypothetical protein J416_09539 [Gracilibacillus halophilus YIM-C55.5]|uniref:DUF1617 family protein n=1 Tax=Gracilibacillus halophilus YIM-C55.5 TaxID=1308866 RepID=N4WQJ5_9BACI|nr:DUF1617 family protein [Gracilibacillus halophilus]ENH96730.1 hypothetical protein J416_09539 [Gracilibacillus halophilus YIM-C55.5]
MIVKIENKYLEQAIDLLFHLSLKGKKSRHRTKLIRKMSERLQEVDEQRVELAKEHAKKDEDGEPVKIDGGKRFDIEDQEAFNHDLKELYEEQLVLDGGDNQGMLKTIRDVLLNCDKEFSGQEAAVYDYLCDQFEGGEA